MAKATLIGDHNSYVQDYICEKKHNYSIYEKSILHDLRDVPLPDSIKQKANEIYLKMNIPSKKSSKRKKLLYFCLISAYKELDIVYIPAMIATLVGLSINKISNANSMYSKTITGYQTQQRRFSPTDYVLYLYPTIGIQSGYEKFLVDLTNELINKEERLLDDAPQIVAAAIILYFIEWSGIPYNGIFEQILQTTSIRLNNMKNKINKIHNR